MRLIASRSLSRRPRRGQRQAEGPLLGLPDGEGRRRHRPRGPKAAFAASTPCRCAQGCACPARRRPVPPKCSNPRKHKTEWTFGPLHGTWGRDHGVPAARGRTRGTLAVPRRGRDITGWKPVAAAEPHQGARPRRPRRPRQPRRHRGALFLTSDAAAEPMAANGTDETNEANSACHTISLALLVVGHDAPLEGPRGPVVTARTGRGLALCLLTRCVASAFSTPIFFRLLLFVFFPHVSSP